jgi:hypothetical protein
MFDNCSASDYEDAWVDCELNQESVDNILVSIDASGVLNGIVGIHLGGSSPPGPTGLTAKSSLQSKGWTVTTN